MEVCIIQKKSMIEELGKGEVCVRKLKKIIASKVAVNDLTSWNHVFGQSPTVEGKLDLVTFF